MMESLSLDEHPRQQEHADGPGEDTPQILAPSESASRSQEQPQAQNPGFQDVSVPSPAPKTVPTTRYQYTALNENTQEIRFLVLLPGLRDAEIRICIKANPLYFTQDGRTFLRGFEALSYTWGSQENPRDIFIGETGSQTLSISQNLYEALPYLRYKDRPRWLWIDAISVNQEDLVERTSQVKRMAEIYSRAQMVLIWLGLERDDSSIAIECFRLLASRVRIDWGLNTMVSLMDNKRITNRLMKLPFDNNSWFAIAKILNRNWFKRLWIWQEAGLSRDATVICGTSSVPWISVRTAIFCILVTPKDKRFNEVVELSHRNLLYELCLSTANLAFSTLLAATSHCLCTDPRDRVFALLSMVQTNRNFQLKLDYTVSFQAVYQRTLSHYIEMFKDLSVLSAVELGRRLDGTPSWLPQWSTPRLTRALRFGHASGGSPCSVYFKQVGQENVLSVTGITIAAVDSAQNFELPQGHGYNAIYNGLQRVAVQLRLLECISENMFSLQHLCQILVSMHLADMFVPTGENLSKISSAESFLRRISRSGLDEVTNSPESVRFVSNVGKFCSNRSLFITKDGKIGLGPRETQSGDLVTALLGSDSTIILRPALEGKYEVVGEAICSGTFTGEAFLGSLAAKFDQVQRYHDRFKLYYLGFKDKETGVLQVEDPRLADVPLPNSWRRKEHGASDYVDCFINDETGEDTDGAWDPRMTAEELRKRGVKLEEFDLI